VIKPDRKPDRRSNPYRTPTAQAGPTSKRKRRPQAEGAWLVWAVLLLIAVVIVIVETLRAGWPSAQ
jgi:hypothetical protein